MGIAPVEYVIIGFPGNQFTGEIAPELAKLTGSGQIRILDLVFIAKDDDGAVLVIEVDDREDLMVYLDLDGDVGGIIGDEDIQHAAEAIPAGSSAALLLWEDTWATAFVQAIRNAGGVLIEGSRIPQNFVDEAEALLASTS